MHGCRLVTVKGPLQVTPHVQHISTCMSSPTSTALLVISAPCHRNPLSVRPPDDPEEGPNIPDDETLAEADGDDLNALCKVCVQNRKHRRPLLQLIDATRYHGVGAQHASS